MRMPSVARVLALSVALASCASFAAACSSGVGEGASSSENQALRDLDSEEAAFLSLINEYRAANNLPALTATRLLDQVAYDHSNDMAVNNYFDHNDRQGHSPFDRMKAAGYDGGYEAENIAAGNATAQATFDQWKSSAGHNANMLGAHYTAIGIGRAYASTSTYGWYWTTDFGDVVDSSAIDGGTGSTDAGAVDAARDAASPDAAPPDSGADAGSACAAYEVEPNDSYAQPNALAGSVCGALTANDQDWFSWTASGTGASYDLTLAASGDAQIWMWELVNGGYQRVASTSATEIKGSARGADTFLVVVWSPSGAANASYVLRR